MALDNCSLVLGIFKTGTALGYVESENISHYRRRFFLLQNMENLGSFEQWFNKMHLSSISQKIPTLS